MPNLILITLSGTHELNTWEVDMALIDNFMNIS